MKKLFKIIGLLVVVLIVAIVCVALFWLGPVVKKAVETVGPQATGVAVTVEKVHIRPLRGLVTIDGLFVGNPEGFANPSAVELKEFKVAVNLRSLMGDTIIVKEILIDAPQFTYERKLSTDNIKEIQKNVEAFFGGAGKPAEEPKPGEPAKEPKEKKPAKKV
ncbi:MAG: hypothetical protein K9M45_11390, partial [Kiritimatiellales bacterium]|nr:hypothetical protein [Kiritimatiellales bacterium]